MTKEEFIHRAFENYNKGEITEVSRLCNCILELDPNDYSALYLLGLITYNCNDLAASETYIEKALSLYSSPQLYKLTGDLLLKKGNQAEAIDIYLKTIQSFPDYAEAYNAVGFCLLDQYPDKSVIFLSNAIELGFKSAYLNLAKAYLNLNNISSAIDSYEKAIESYPQLAAPYNDLGSVYFSILGEPEKATKYFEKALNLVEKGSNKHNAIMYNLGKAYLLSNKDMLKGWEYFEARTELFEHHKLKLPESQCPKWTGQDINGKSIYIYQSGGAGDSLLFARYIPIIKAMGGKTHCQVFPSLKQLFIDSNLGDYVYTTDETLDSTKFDYQIPFMSLANAFKTSINSIPFPEGYIKSDPEKVRYYKEKYFNNECFKIGIVWQSGDRNFRNIPHIEYFYDFAKLKGVQVYSLQKEFVGDQLKNLPEGVEIIDLGSTFNNFADTAAAIENLDLVITVDTSVAHVAGALGKPAWILLHYVSDWRWFLDPEKSPWYNSARLCRMKPQSNWAHLLRDVLEAVLLKINKSNDSNDLRLRAKREC